MRFNTKILHEKFPSDIHGATLPPIYQVSAFAHESAEKLEKVFENKAPGFAYSRISNPTVSALEKRIAMLEGGADAVSCASGMAAVSMALLNILQSGDEIVAGSGLFGGTLDLLEDLKAFGIKTHFLSKVTAGSVKKAITPNTKLVFTELIGNPRLDVVDVKAVSQAAQEYGIPLFIDSTTATPALIRPFEFGAAIVIHSSSKYINGSGNAISGMIVDSGKFNWDFEKFSVLKKYSKYGRLAFSVSLRQRIIRNFGACIAPQTAYLNCLGMETLGLRMERTCQNALSLAKFLETLPEISVNYPGLKSSEYYPIVKSQLNGAGGAILTLRVGSREKAFKFINSLKYACIATNIGDIRTLVIHPASTIYALTTKEQKLAAGVFDDMIRISVGIEDIEDIKEDFTNALLKTNKGDIA